MEVLELLGPCASGIPNRLDNPRAEESIAVYVLKPIWVANVVVMHKRTVDIISGWLR